MTLSALKRNASKKNRRAMRILEGRGFRFLVHFGTKNAHDILRQMNRAKRQGKSWDSIWSILK